MDEKREHDVTMRIRAYFAKIEPMRFTSHLDLYRAWERLLRRASVPLIFSQGFNPRPRMQLASPLPLGFTSQDEIIDFWVKRQIDDLAVLATQLVQAQPPGIEVNRVEIVDPDSPSLQNRVSAAEYIAVMLSPVHNLDLKIQDLLASETIIRKRHGKTYDLRPLIQALEAYLGNNDEGTSIFMRLDAHEGKTGRPDEVMLSLDIPPEGTRIERQKIIFQNDLYSSPEGSFIVHGLEC